MGVWGSGLYENDFTCDVRDTYVSFLEKKYSNKEAYVNTLKEFLCCLGTDQEPLLWYALADTQWTLGRLDPEVLNRAMYWLDNYEKNCLWLDDTCKKKTWIITTNKLRMKITSPQKKEKVIYCPADYQFNPGNIGDVFAYQFHTKNAKEVGCHGKYILFQKINVIDIGKGYSCPHCVFFDEIFETIPEKVHLEQMRILPFDLPGRFLIDGRNTEFPILNMGAVLELSKKKNTPQKYVFFVGSYPIVDVLPTQANSQSNFGWDCIEQTLLVYKAEWRQYSYQLYSDYSVVLSKGCV